MVSAALSDLLVQSAALLEDWDVAVKQGSRDLSVLLDQLPQLTRKPASSRAVAALLDKAGCTSLSALLDCPLPHRYNDVGLAAELQAAYTGLQNAVVLARNTCLSFQELATDAQQMPEQPEPDAPAVLSLEDDDYAASSPEDVDAVEWGAAVAAAAPLHDEEAKLLLLITLKQLQKQLEVMELIAGAVRLSTPEGELYTYATMWDLQPFVDDRTLQYIQQFVQQLPPKPGHAAVFMSAHG